MFIDRTKVYIKALLTGRVKYLTWASEDNLKGLYYLCQDHPNDILSLLRWVNRNRTLLDLVSLNRQHALRVVVGKDEIRVNCHLTTDEENGLVLEDPIESGGIYGFYQKDWEDAMGAEYAPFMTPIKDDGVDVYYDPKPLFSYRVKLTEDQLSNVVERDSALRIIVY